MDAGVKVSIIAAVANNLTIGRNGDIPWRLKADLSRFKRRTTGHTVIVGRKTYESILRRLGHPLPDRRIIVVSRQVGYQAAGCEVAHSFEGALELVGGEQEVFVIGGAELYRTALPQATKLYLTRVNAFVMGDTFMPSINLAGDWRRISEEWHDADDENEYSYCFEVYERLAHVNLGNARYDDQLAVMQRIDQEGICPFCPENRQWGEVLDPIWRGKHWVLVPNRWPYEFTTLHLMAITERHVRYIHELGLNEWDELFEVIAWVVTAHGIQGGAVGIRFGDPTMNGATVDHLHTHIIVADQNVTQPGYQRVRFPLGPKPPKPKEEKTPGS